jgi:hypothetical protein
MFVLVAAFVACRKTEVPQPANPVSVSAPAAITPGGPGLMYFGTPYILLNTVHCTQPCGVCHVTTLPDGYMPRTGDPENNEALMNGLVNAEGQLVFSVDLNGVGHMYTDQIEQTQQLPVAMQTEIPHQLVEQACLSSNVPVIPGPVFIPAGNYPVAVPVEGGYSHLQLTGTFMADGAWTWTVALN